MNTYQLNFTLFSTLVGPVWLMMILAPKWHVTLKLMQSQAIIVLFMLPYAILAIPRMASVLPLFMLPKLPAIMELLGSQSGAALAWLHFIGVDLFVGRWIYLDSRKNGMNVALMAPILFFTAMLCPFGFILYSIARAVARPSAPVASSS